MRDCKKHYTDMYETRLGNRECPFCQIATLTAEKQDNHDRAEAIIAAREAQIHRMHDEINTLTAENKELRHTIEQLVSEAANTPELLKELSRYRKGVEISEYVSKGQTTWNDDGTTYSEGIIAIPKEFIGQRVRVIVIKEEQ